MDIQVNKDVNLRLNKMNRKLIKPKQGESKKTETWRREEKGPSYYKIEGKILYGLDDLQNFIEGSRVSVS